MVSAGTHKQPAVMRTQRQRQTERDGEETDRAGKDFIDFFGRPTGPLMWQPTGIWPSMPDGQHTNGQGDIKEKSKMISKVEWCVRSERITMQNVTLNPKDWNKDNIYLNMVKSSSEVTVSEWSFLSDSVVKCSNEWDTHTNCRELLCGQSVVEIWDGQLSGRHTDPEVSLPF